MKTAIHIGIARPEVEIRDLDDFTLPQLLDLQSNLGRHVQTLTTAIRQKLSAPNQKASDASK